MNQLTKLLASLEQQKVTLNIRGLLYNKVDKTPKNTYIFTHSDSLDRLEAQLSFLDKLFQDDRLFDPSSKNVRNNSYQSNINFIGRLASKSKINIVTNSAITTIQTKHKLSIEEATEMEALLCQMRPMNFRTSKQLSNYIVQHKLGNKYPTISGIARMTNGYDEWNFDGGFPPEIYKIICRELQLSNQGTNSWIVGFSSFGSMK
ncbi:hypothetical protein [Vibrio rhodolitus]|uniref:hypothetical protein n=1 Tax=Vibrio rhodolitus TaxID=2231649 RepID=UPI000F4EFA86|nr:hypothetical protein [Vibrio rhodolitus]